ncbi:MAG: hypothetical protein GF419_07345 [Ignavibacteriales bacterium]|nr:hypothetical protein [Ignavibacteriales bacterium]
MKLFTLAVMTAFVALGASVANAQNTPEEERVVAIVTELTAYTAGKLEEVMNNQEGYTEEDYAQLQMDMEEKAEELAVKHGFEDFAQADSVVSLYEGADFMNELEVELREKYPILFEE